MTQDYKPVHKGIEDMQRWIARYSSVDAPLKSKDIQLPLDEQEELYNFLKKYETPTIKTGGNN